MAKRGRPVAYQSEDERPVTVSLRIPRDLYEQVERYVKLRPGMTLTEFFLDGTRLRLDTPADPRDYILYDDNTVIRELQEMVNAAVERALMKERLAPPALDIPTQTLIPEAPAQPVATLTNYNSTVLQKSKQSTPVDADHSVAPEADEQPSSELQNYDNTDNTVIQEKGTSRKTGRLGTMREAIVTLLRSHPGGLTAEQIRGFLSPAKPLGDTLQGMRRQAVVRIEGQGRELRYFLNR